MVKLEKAATERTDIKIRYELFGNVRKSWMVLEEIRKCL